MPVKPRFPAGLPSGARLPRIACAALYSAPRLWEPKPHLATPPQTLATVFALLRRAGSSAPPRSRRSAAPGTVQGSAPAPPRPPESPRARYTPPRPPRRPRPRPPNSERRRAAANPSPHRRSSPLHVSCALRRGKSTTPPPLTPCFPSDRRTMARRRDCGRATPPGTAARHGRAPMRPLARPDEFAVAHASSLT